MARSWRFLVFVLPVALMSERPALATETEADDRYATDVLLCRGPFTIRYVEKEWGFQDHSLNLVTRLSGSLQIPVTMTTGKVGLGQNLARGQCGWLAGKNPEVQGIKLVGESLHHTPMVRTIEEDPTGTQTVRVELPYAGVAKSPKALFMFKVAHQPGDTVSDGKYVVVKTAPKITHDVKFKLF